VHSEQKGWRTVVAELSEGFSQGGLGQTLRIGFRRVGEETIVGRQQVGNQAVEVEISSNVRGSSDQVVIAVLQRLAEGGHCQVGIRTQRFESAELAVEDLVAHFA